MQHISHSRTRTIKAQVRPEPTTPDSNRPEASNTLQNHQEPQLTCHNHAKVAILERKDLSTTGHHYHAASKKLAELEKIIHRVGQNLQLPSRTEQKH